MSTPEEATNLLMAHRERMGDVNVSFTFPSELQAKRAWEACDADERVKDVGTWRTTDPERSVFRVTSMGESANVHGEPLPEAEAALVIVRKHCRRNGGTEVPLDPQIGAQMCARRWTLLMTALEKVAAAGGYRPGMRAKQRARYGGQGAVVDTDGTTMPVQRPQG